MRVEGLGTWGGVRGGGLVEEVRHKTEGGNDATNEAGHRWHRWAFLAKV